jgi:hypothetical protein
MVEMEMGEGDGGDGDGEGDGGDGDGEGDGGDGDMEGDVYGRWWETEIAERR